MADALRDRGISEPAASLAAETGAAVFKVAFGGAAVRVRMGLHAGEPDRPHQCDASSD